MPLSWLLWTPPRNLWNATRKGLDFAVDTGVAKFDDEGRAFWAWRSAVWAKGYEILAQVQAGERDIPSEEELIAELPALSIVYGEG